MAEALGSQWRFGYADIGVLGVGSTAEAAVQAAQAEVDQIVQWVSANEVAFDLDKTEFILFRSTRAKADPEPLTIVIGDRTFQPSECLRWLGARLDARLNFRTHVEHWTSEGLQLAQHFRRIGSVTRGVAPGPMVRAVQACVVAQAFQASEAWWSGETRETARGKVGSGQVWHTNFLDTTVSRNPDLTPGMEDRSSTGRPASPRRQSS